jgi:hypothetical protein
VYDRRPGSGGNVLNRSDRHVLELHQPLPKTPLSFDAAIEWEQLPGVRGALQTRRSAAYVAVVHEVFNVPFDTLRDFLCEFPFGHRFRFDPIVFGRNLSGTRLP